MKKWIIYMLLVLFTATTASAQWWKLGLGEEEQAAEPKQQMQRGQQSGQQRGQRSKMSEEKRAEMKAKHGKMKAEREATQKLVDAARTETDPVKKAELVGQLRAKVTEHVDKMHARQKKRLETAEKELPKLRERFADAEKNKEQKIEEHLQKLLSGEKPERSKGKRSGKKGPKPVE